MASPDKASQEFLDQNQYTRQGILRYEKIFGKGFVSTGGIETTKEFVKLLNLKPGQKVLDVGCGIGGGAFYMAKNFKVDVLGVDLSTNMIQLATERAAENPVNKVQFVVTDVTEEEYEPESFDVVYSRDVFLHIKGKEALFSNFLKWLKPDGQLLISDYCWNEDKASDDMRAYVAQRAYHLTSVANYGKILEKIGFIDVIAEDKTETFVEILKKEKERTEKSRQDFLKEFSEEDFNYIINGWNSKLDRCARGDQTWGLLYAKKSAQDNV